MIIQSKEFDQIRDALETALNQWGMYADMIGREDERVRLIDEKTPEGDLYRHCRKVLRELVGSPPDERENK